MFKNLNFKTQLYLGNGTVLVLMIIIAVVVYQSIHSLISTSRWVTYTYDVIEQGRILQKSLTDMETGERGFLLTGKEAFLEPYSKGKEIFEEVVVKAQKMIEHNQELVELLEKTHELADQWDETVAMPAIEKRKQIADGIKDARYLEEFLSTGVGKNIMDEIQQILEQLQKQTTDSNNQTVELLLVSLAKKLFEQESGQRGFLITGKEDFLQPYNTGITALEKQLQMLEQHWAEKPANLQQINKLRQLINQWREKAVAPELAVRREMNKNTMHFQDIIAPIEKGDGKKLMDKAQALLESFIAQEKKLLAERQENTMQKAHFAIYVSLYGTLLALFIGILLIALLTRNIMRFVDKVIVSSQAVSNEAEEIAQGNLNLSQRTQEQAASLQETAASMEQMTSTVQQNTENARQATHLAMNARERAQKGGQVVNSAVIAMSEINNSSKQMADIIGVIDEIAFQTNLLALNAAVEAARAGEQGRGFAVVATEVRSLAQRSASAAKEIKALIQDSVKKTEEGTRLVNESGKTLEEIVAAVKQASDFVVEIASASEEQSSGIQQVNKAIAQLDDITQQNASLVEEAASASEAMKQQAQNLKDLVSFFKNHVKSLAVDTKAKKEQNHSLTQYHHKKPSKKSLTKTSHQPVQHSQSPHHDHNNHDKHHDDNEWEDF
jgi:methyl-accepting chemotaxis protein